MTEGYAAEDMRGAIELVLRRLEHDGPVEYQDPIVGGLVELLRIAGTSLIGATTEQLREWLQFNLTVLDLDEIDPERPT